MAHTKEKHAESEKKEAVEQTTRRSREEENALFVKLLIGFSIVQLVLGALLYLFAVVNTWTLGTLAVIAIVGCVLGVKMWDEHKAVRIVVRIVELLTALACPLLVLIQWIILAAVEGTQAFTSQITAYQVLTLMVFGQLTLLFILPVMAVTASRGKRFDIILVRIFSVIQLILALAFCFLADIWPLMNLYFAQVLQSIDNIYFEIFYCLCTAITAVSAFIIYPTGFCSRLKERFVRPKPKAAVQKKA
jgi:membrane protein